MHSPYIVAIGGTTRPFSSTEKALRIALDAAEAAGAETALIAGQDIMLPLYMPEHPDRSAAAQHMLREIARADGLLVGSPGYHGSLSGLVKNALDYVEDLARDQRPYFSGRAVGCITTAAGHQGAVATLGALRSIVHALRGWPTPLGAAINTLESPFDACGGCTDPRATQVLQSIGTEIVEFARRWRCANTLTTNAA
ncbi:MAG: NADPH-dependent FMN reductase [Pseudomonas sp.]